MSRGFRACALMMGSAIVVSCGGGGSPAPIPPGGSVGETITGRERIGWDQSAASAADLAPLSYAIYVDGTRSVLADVTCASTAGPAGFPCSGRLPPLSNGAHVLEIAAFGDTAGLIESSRSAPLRVTVTGAEAAAGAVGLTPGEILTTADGVPFILEQLATGLVDPTDVALAPDGRVWMTDASGRLHVLEEGRSREVLRVAESAPAGGLLSITLAPDFEASGHLFVLGAVPVETGNVFRVVRYRAVRDTVVDALTLLPDVAASRSPAGAVRFGPDGRLYVAFDGADDDERALRPSEWSGKILRLEPDGRTPPDQPAASPVLWSGVRTPRGMAWGEDGILWTAEDGVDGVERLRAIETEPGAIRRIGSRRSYALPRPFGGRAVAIHRGGSVPALSGDLLLAGANAGYLLRIGFDREDRARATRTEKLLDGRGETIRAVAVDRGGSIYFCTTDRLWRLRAPASPPGRGSR